MASKFVFVFTVDLTNQKSTRKARAVAKTQFHALIAWKDSEPDLRFFTFKWSLSNVLIVIPKKCNDKTCRCLSDAVLRWLRIDGAGRPLDPQPWAYGHRAATNVINLRAICEQRTIASAIGLILLRSACRAFAAVQTTQNDNTLTGALSEQKVAVLSFFRCEAVTRANFKKYVGISPSASMLSIMSVRMGRFEIAAGGHERPRRSTNPFVFKNNPKASPSDNFQILAHFPFVMRHSTIFHASETDSGFLKIEVWDFGKHGNSKNFKKCPLSLLENSSLTINYFIRNELLVLVKYLILFTSPRYFS